MNASARIARSIARLAERNARLWELRRIAAERPNPDRR
jgi:hypothetical protein